MLSGVSFVLFVILLSIFIFTSARVRGVDSDSGLDEVTNLSGDVYRGMVSDLDYIKSLEQKILSAETRQQQESALRCVFWLVFDNPERLSMQLSVTDENGIERIDDILSAKLPLNVTVCLSETETGTEQVNWDYSFQFTPKHLDNLFILVGNDQ